MIGISGSCEPLGNWDPEKALVLKKQDTNDWWECEVLLPISDYFEWKLVVMELESKKVVRWEDRGNRWNWVDKGPMEVTAWWNEGELSQCLLMECKYLHCHCLTPYTDLKFKHGDLVTVIFLTHFSYEESGQVLAVSGSGCFLGNWDPKLARQFDKTASQQLNRLSLTITMPMNETAEWKFVLINKRFRRVIKWEDHPNRQIDTKFPEQGVTKRRMTIGANWNEVAYKVTKNFKCVDDSCQCNAHVPSPGGCKQEKAAASAISASQEQAQTSESGSQIQKTVHFSNNPVTEVRVFEKDIEETLEGLPYTYSTIPVKNPDINESKSTG